MSGKNYKILVRRRTKTFIKMLQCWRQKFHKNPSLIFKLIILNVIDNILVMNFRENFQLIPWLLKVLVKINNFFNCCQYTCLNIKSLINTTTRPTPKEFANFPFFNTQILFDWLMWAFFWALLSLCEIIKLTSTIGFWWHWYTWFCFCKFLIFWFWHLIRGIIK